MVTGVIVSHLEIQLGRRKGSNTPMNQSRSATDMTLCAVILTCMSYLFLCIFIASHHRISDNSVTLQHWKYWQVWSHCGSSVCIVTRLWDGWQECHSWQGRIFVTHNIQMSVWAHATSYLMGTSISPWCVIATGVWSYLQACLVLRLRMPGAIPSFTHVFMVITISLYSIFSTLKPNGINIYHFHNH
jgi:hypothetical protein